MCIQCKNLSFDRTRILLTKFFFQLRLQWYKIVQGIEEALNSEKSLEHINIILPHGIKIAFYFQILQ